MPDVFIWLVSNGKRLAYHRIPARDLIYSEFPEECGKFCGKLQTIFLKVRAMLFLSTYNLITLGKSLSSFIKGCNDIS